jgi:ankyrin repeat protein
VRIRRGLARYVHNRTSVYIVLKHKGAYVNALDRDSVSPLILASNLGDLEIVRMLIKHGANMNQTDRMNSSALHYASMRFHADIARELIQHGCICNTNTPFSFCSPLKYLLFDKQYATVKLLVESGCDLSSERWIMDTNVRSSHISNKEKPLDAEFLNWIRTYVKNPCKLMSLCRQKIRANLGNQYLEKKIHTLNIPVYMKQYLMMKF